MRFTPFIVTIFLTAFIILGCDSMTDSELLIGNETGVPDASFSAPLNWTVYNQDNSGLPDEWIRSVAVEDNGVVWIGTNSGGMAGFDGSEWTVYHTGNSDLPDNRVNAIAIDKDGTKWIGTGDGLASYDGTNWVIFTRQNSDLPHDSGSLSSEDWISTIAIDDDGTKWIGTVDILASLDENGAWARYDSGPYYLSTVSIATDPQQTKWFATIESGLASFNGADWSYYNPEEPSSSYDLIAVSAVAVDASGTKWMGAYGYEHSGLASLNEGSLTYFDIGPYSTENKVYALAIDSDDTKWVGLQDGLQTFDGTSWTNHEIGELGLPGNPVNAVVIDKNGTKWIGTRHGLAASVNNTP